MRFLPLFIALILLTQCTVERRIHRNGWHVEWKKIRFKQTTKGDKTTALSKEFLDSEKEEAQLKSTTSDISDLVQTINSTARSRKEIRAKKIQPLKPAEIELNLSETLFPEDSTYFDKVKKDRTEEKENKGTNKVFTIVAIIILALLLLTILLFQVISTSQPAGVLLALGLIIIGYVLIIAAVATLIIFLIYKYSSRKKKEQQKNAHQPRETDESDTTTEGRTNNEEEEEMSHGNTTSTTQNEKQNRKFIPWIFGGIAAFFVIGYLFLSK